jgi:glycosyltransferase involved in cell wall biosynthesis
MLSTQVLPTISLIIPALNEEAVIEQTVRQIIDAAHGRFAEYEMILVNDGSTDATGTIMDRLAEEFSHIQVIHNYPNLGLGKSYQRGVNTARFEYVMMLCGDGGLPALSLPDIWARIGDADIVVPYMRNLRQIKSLTRFITSRGYTTLLNLLFRQNLHYYNGLPVHRLELLRKIKITSDGFGFQGEILTKLLKSGCSHVQVGVLGSKGRERSSAVKVKNLLSVFKTIWDLLIEMTRFQPIEVTPSSYQLTKTQASYQSLEQRDSVPLGRSQYAPPHHS